VAKVLAAGKTPAGSHRPVMVAEILSVVFCSRDERAVRRGVAKGDFLAPDHRQQKLSECPPFFSGRLSGEPRFHGMDQLLDS
jgi:hypothetical protein